MEKILTVSVAAYNLGELIEKNLESFVKCKQLEKIEVLVIDDGSKDDTYARVMKYVNIYPKSIKIIKQENAGPGSTINTALKNASGKYFRLVDGDDWIDSENLDKLISNLQNVDVDMIINDFYVYDDENQKIKNIVTFDIEKEKVLNPKQFNPKIDLLMHGTIYKTELFKKNNIIFDNGFYTDLEYLIYPIPYVEKIIYYNFPIYFYRVGREGQSISIYSKLKHLDMHETVLYNLINYYEDAIKKLDNNLVICVRNKILAMSTGNLNILLAKDKVNVNEVKQFNLNIRNKSEEIYKHYKFKSQCIPIIYSNYLLTNLVSKIYKKKILKVKCK